jgi:predicted transcriptional regulator
VKKGDELRKKILDVGLKVWPNVKTCEIARKLGISHPNVSYYFRRGLKDAVAQHAVETGHSQVIAQLILTKHKAIRNMPLTERRKHMKAASLD